MCTYLLNDIYVDIFERLSNYPNMSIQEYKYSFVIVKPNGAYHFEHYLNELKKQNFHIFGCFAIKNHENINLALHLSERERSHVVPINKMFQDFYCNFAILILISKKDISYADFVKDVFDFKWYARSIVDVNYISYVFDTSDILQVPKSQILKIIDSNGDEVKKYDMNNKGCFMVCLPNSLHSPDASVSSTLHELNTLFKMGLICKQNIIPETILLNILKYKTFEFLQDM